MTKGDTLGGKKTELRIVTPAMSDKAIASAICSAEHGQKETVRKSATAFEPDLEQQSASRSKKLKDCRINWTG